MSSITRSNSTILKDKFKSFDIRNLLGFNPETLPSPNSININHFSFEMFFENALKPEIGKFILNSDHIEHGFQIISEISETEELSQLKLLINHIFLLSFIEILFSDSSNRSNLFLERQSSKTTLTQDEIRQLIDLDPEMTDSISTIFNHLIAPLYITFDNSFYDSLTKFLTNDTAPAVSFLLRYFLHDKSCSSSSLTNLTDLLPPPKNICVQKDQFPQFFTETSSHHIHQRSNAFAEFRMVRVIPTLFICRPKYIPPQIPSLSCFHLPKYIDFCKIDKKTTSVIYSIGSELFKATQNHVLKKLFPHEYSVSSLSISNDGQFLLSGDIFGFIQVQNLNKSVKCWYQPIRSLVTCSAWSPLLPHQFAIGTISGIIALYDISKLEIQRLFIEHNSSIVSIEIHPNSEFIISTALDSTIRVWSLSLGVCVRVIKTPGPIPSLLKIANHGKWILIGTNCGELSIIDLGSTNIIKNYKNSFGIILGDFSPNDELIAIVDKNYNYLIWESKETRAEPPESIRIERTKVLSLEFLDQNEVRVASCQK